LGIDLFAWEKLHDEVQTPSARPLSSAMHSGTGIFTEHQFR
jgi:hypothetical protein